VTPIKRLKFGKKDQFPWNDDELNNLWKLRDYYHWKKVLITEPIEVGNTMNSFLLIYPLIHFVQMTNVINLLLITSNY
jgi:hypothetical protein